MWIEHLRLRLGIIPAGSKLARYGGRGPGEHVETELPAETLFSESSLA